LVITSEGKKPIGRPSRRFEVNFTMDLKDILWRVWTGFMWLMIIKMMSIRVPFHNEGEVESTSSKHPILRVVS
jgi:hypothetical protein